MLRITKYASAYLENVWVWVADHDMDNVTQDQIDVYAARGVLIESQSPTWLWGTSSEHCILYQYQLPGASDIVLGLTQTEPPYFQATPAAPAPFQKQLGAFADDPRYEDCPAGAKGCAISWAVRIVDSSSIFVLSTGLYTWFQAYDRTCIDSTRHGCQNKAFYTEKSQDIWIYNLITVEVVEIMNPFNGNATMAAQNRNGFASSIVASISPKAFKVDDSRCDTPCIGSRHESCGGTDYIAIYTTQLNGTDPEPTLPDYVDACSKFHNVKDGQSREGIARENGITVADFAGWNHKTAQDCTSFRAGTDVCVGLKSLHDFSSDPSKDWSFESDYYTVKSGALVASSSNGKRAVIRAPLMDFILAADVSVPGKSGDAGLVFRLTEFNTNSDAFTGYYTGISAAGNGFLVIGRENNVWNEIRKVPLSIKTGTVYRLKIQVLADEISVFVDDKAKPKLTAASMRAQNHSWRRRASAARPFSTRSFLTLSSTR